MTEPLHNPDTVKTVMQMMRNTNNDVDGVFRATGISKKLIRESVTMTASATICPAENTNEDEANEDETLQSNENSTLLVDRLGKKPLR